MLRRLCQFILLICCCLAVPLPAQAENWALLVGIDEYKDTNHINGLGGAAADARALKTVLVTTLNFPENHIDLLVSKDASRSDLLEALTRLKTRAKEGDFVFVFYAGHGMEIKGKTYLLPFDATATSDDDIVDSALPSEKFYERLSQVKARMLFLCFDMCRSNPLKESRDATQENTLNDRGIDWTTTKTNIESALVVTLYACSPGERAYEDRVRSRGFFSRYLEEGLQGKAKGPTGAITVNSLTKYLNDEVPKAVRRDVGGQAKQTPYPIPAGPGAGEFELVPAERSPINLNAGLEILVNAPDAAIQVDGENVPVTESGLGGDPAWKGQFSTSLPDKEAKTVRILVKAPGYIPEPREVELERGVVKSVNITLAPIPPPSPPSLRINPVDGAEMVLIPAGEFLMGDDDDAIKDPESGKRNNPRRRVRLPAYYIYKNLVTVAMYRKFCGATGHKMPNAPEWGWEENHPIVNVSWNDAKAYCAWAKTQLPTEEQWEKAARGTDGRAYPWGKDFDRSRVHCSRSKPGDARSTAPVGQKDKGSSPYGVLDMAGNVLQWCEDPYDPQFWEKKQQRGDFSQAVVGQLPETRVVRGGAWWFVASTAFRTAFRNHQYPDTVDTKSGFRCVVEL